jgi:hypothetical protein
MNGMNDALKRAHSEGAAAMHETMCASLARGLVSGIGPIAAYNVAANVIAQLATEVQAKPGAPPEIRAALRMAKALNECAAEAIREIRAEAASDILVVPAGVAINGKRLG